MQHFLERTWDRTRPWLILGKGPSFSKVLDPFFPVAEYNILGLNHVAEKIRVNVSLVIDFCVINNRISKNSNYIVLPWHPHVDFKASVKTLPYYVNRYDVTHKAKKEGRILWYNLSTWKKKHNPCPYPTVKTLYFSAESAFYLLALAGVKEIRTLGIDGGSSYAKEFSHLEPLTNGQLSFTKQFTPIKRIIEKFQINYKAL